MRGGRHDLLIWVQAELVVRIVEDRKVDLHAGGRVRNCIVTIEPDALQVLPRTYDIRMIPAERNH